MRPSAESILIICSFCGEIVAESSVSPHVIVKPLPMTPPPGPGHVRKMELILVPFFEVQSSVDVEALGYQRRERTETKTVTRGGKTYTESKTIVEYRPWRIEHHGNQVVRFLARQEFTMFGAGELISSVARNIGGEFTPFSSQYIKDLASTDISRSLVALSPEWDQNEATKKAGEMVYEAAYSYARSQMHEVFDTKVNFRPLAIPALVHEPLLLVQRQIQGRLYRAAYHWGNGQLLREEQPIKNRSLMFVIAFLAFLLSPVFAELGYSFYTANEDEVWLLVIFAILGLGCIITGIVLMVRAYKPHKVKSSGSGVSLFDFQRIAAPQQQPTQRQPNPRLQQQPGKPAMRYCSKCGDPLDENQKFCEKCGEQTGG